jgi:Zn-dependent protease/predicted transcriptional regulator
MRQFRIGSAFGIPIKLDLTFLLILPFFAWIIGSQVERIAEQFNEVLQPGIEVAALVEPAFLPWIIGTAAALGLFVGVVLHELGHSVVAMRYGFPIDSITLWIFGGIAKLTDMPEDWKQELAIAIAGPIVSVALGAGFAGAYLLVPGSLPAVQFVVAYLAAMNVALAVFNLLPAFPMDGGRVLRALLARTRPFARATKIAADVGKLFAILMGILGLLGPNILLIGIAFFVYIGAANEAQQTAMKAAFEGVTVRDLMTPAEEVEDVAPETTVAELIERMFEERHTGYPVTENGELVGLVTLSDAQSVRPVERDAFLLEEIMTRDLVTIDAGADAMTALTEMNGEGVGRLLVSADGQFVGLVTRSDLMTAFNIIQSSGSLPDSAMSGEGRAVETAPEEFRFER